jgi:hypothetical protein
VGPLAQIPAVADEPRGGVVAGAGTGGLAVLDLKPGVVADQVVAARGGGAVALGGGGAAEAVGRQQELRHVGAAGHPSQVGVGGAEQRAGVQALVVAKAAQVGDGGGGERLLAVAGVGDVAGQRQPVALGQLAGERLAVQGRWRVQGPLPGVGALQLEGERALGVGQLGAAAQRDPPEVLRAATR